MQNFNIKAYKWDEFCVYFFADLEATIMVAVLPLHLFDQIVETIFKVSVERHAPLTIN